MQNITNEPRTEMSSLRKNIGMNITSEYLKFTKKNLRNLIVTVLIFQTIVYIQFIIVNSLLYIQLYILQIETC